ncbi:MAG: alkaline phosphatase family protein [Thermoplasmatales archaeon]
MKLYALLIIIIVIVSLFLPAALASSQCSLRTPIKHVINIFFENHTFDNLFGTYPGNSTTNILNLSRPLNLLNNATLLHSLNAVPPGTFSTPDPIEGYLPYHEDWDNGLMNGFLNGSGPQSLYYYTASQVSPLWDLAEEYAIADRYFAPQIGESAPNTLYYLAGFSPVFNDYGPPPFIPINETIFGELNYYGISWGIYVYGDKKEFDMSQYITGLGKYENNILDWQAFNESLSSGNLPNVSYVFSQGGNGYDMGAPSNILKGELWLLYLIDEIERSKYWNSTAIFITWDDPGGYYDQVPPPIVDGVQLGFRLPLIVISPYAKEDYISNTLMTHSSILAFIDYNWKLPALNQFVGSLPVPLDIFNFNKSYSQGNVARAPLQFSSFPVPMSPYFNLSQIQLNFNYSSEFPMKPQYNFTYLPYAREGKANQSLLDMGSGIFVKRDVSVTPFYLSSIFVLLIVFLDVILLIVWRFKNGWKKDT